MKRMVDLRRKSWGLKRLGGIAAAAVILLLASTVFYHATRTWTPASMIVGWSVICGCAAGLSFVLLNRAGALLAKTRADAIREERERMARELHDTLVQSCASVSMMLEAIASTSVAQSDLLHQAREQSLKSVEEARHAILNLRSSGDVDLVAALHGVADEIRRSSGKLLQVKQNVAHLPVPANSADEISMTVREALRNAVRHSGSERIMMELKSRRAGLSIYVQDFGCGIVPAVPVSGHYGMVGMRERMRRLGGGVEVQAVPGGGTAVQLILRWGPLRKASMRI
jgi:signal transduction histidine kinase